LDAGSVDSGVLDSSVHWGQRLAKPGLSGFSSNSSLQMAQILMGKGISAPTVILNHGWGRFLEVFERELGNVGGRTEVVWEGLHAFARMRAGQGGHS
jgi:hypothetical protein